MPLVSMKEMLKDAREKKYAVGCYNAINLDMARGVVEAAEAERSPVILCHAEVHFKYTPLEKIAPALVNEAKHATVPVALLLDHGKSFGAVVRAMHAGFNAVMYDGSELDYDDNLRNTAEIVKIAHSLGATVEAELGHVTRPKSGGAEGDEDDASMEDASLYTDPLQARTFVAESGADALAVAFGTAHGLYLKQPQLDLERLRRIRDQVDAPLVMHGGSGLSAADFQGAIAGGVAKINYYTGMAWHAAVRIREVLANPEANLFYHHLMMTAIETFRSDAQETMRCFGSNGRA